MQVTEIPVKRQDGPLIRSLRRAAGHKQGEFAGMVRLHVNSLDNIERNRRNASPEVLHRIANALGVAYEELLDVPEQVTS